MPALGARALMRHPGATTFGVLYPELWSQTPVDGEPGPRPQYSDAYYGCFVRDPDGHRIEATYWDQAEAG